MRNLLSQRVLLCFIKLILGNCYVHAFFNILYPETRAILAQHNYAHQIMHPPSAEKHHNYLHAAPGLEP